MSVKNLTRFAFMQLLVLAWACALVRVPQFPPPRRFAPSSVPYCNQGNFYAPCNKRFIEVKA